MKLTSGLTGALKVSLPDNLPSRLPALIKSAEALTPGLCLNRGEELTTAATLSNPGEAGERVANARDKPPPIE